MYPKFSVLHLRGTAERNNTMLQAGKVSVRDGRNDWKNKITIINKFIVYNSNKFIIYNKKKTWLATSCGSYSEARNLDLSCNTELFGYR